MGICLYIKHGDRQYEARPYNIYLFPREYGYNSPQISIDSSAADFNTKHDMDWNTWFREGVVPILDPILIYTRHYIYGS